MNEVPLYGYKLVPEKVSQTFGLFRSANNEKNQNKKFFGEGRQNPEDRVSDHALLF